MLGWLWGRSREAALARELDDVKAELATVKAAAEGLLVSSGHGSMPMQHHEMQKSAELLQAYRGWPYVATSAIAKRIAGQPITLSRVSGRRVRKAKNGTPTNLEPIAQHELIDLLNDPNPLGTQWVFLYATVCNLLLAGKAFWWMVEDEGRRQLYWLPASWIAGHEGGARYTAWQVKPPGHVESFRVPAEEMTYFSLPDPADPFGAVSPVRAVAPAINADEAIQTSQTAGFRNGIFPKHAIVLAKGAGPDGKATGGPVSLTNAQRNQLLASVRAMYQGASKSQEPLIVGDAMIESIIKLSNSPDEMDWTESGKSLRERILMAFSVNGIVAGQVESANRASSTEAERHVVNNAVNPLCVAMSQVMTEFLAPAFAADGEKLVLTITPCEVHDEEMTYKRWQLLCQHGAVTTNELRKYAGLAEVDGGDLPLVPTNSIDHTLDGMIGSRLVDYGAASILATWQGKSLNGHARVQE
jgi:HK97 family phage portal protein